MTEFQVGQEVVKIKYTIPGHPGAKADIGDLLTDGQIYIVRWVGVHAFIGGEAAALRVAGVTRVTQSQTKPGDVNVDVPWGSIQFRPVQKNIVTATVSKGLSMFRKLASDATEKRKITVRENV